MSAARKPGSPTSTTARFRAALTRWTKALSSRGDPPLTRAAVTSDATVLRFASDDPTTPRERFEGEAAIIKWLGRSPANIRFTIVKGSVTIEGEAARARYRIAVADFVNHGSFLVRLATDGRLAFIEHRPDPLPVV